MRFSLRNITNIKEADINISGITVLTGECGTGKSNMCRTLFSFIHGLSVCHESLCPMLRVSDQLDCDLNDAVTTISDSVVGSHIELENRYGKSYLHIDPTSEYYVDGEVLEDHEVLDAVYPDSIKEIYHTEDTVPARIQTFIGMVNSFLPDRLRDARSHGSQMEINDTWFGEKVNSKGERLFMNIRDIVKNGMIDRNTILILDGVDGYLHPVWQIRLGKILAALAADFNIRSLVVTNSPYTLRSIEVHLEERDIADALNIYEMVKDEDGVSTAVLCDPERVYKEFFNPFQELENICWEIHST